MLAVLHRGSVCPCSKEEEQWRQKDLCAFSTSCNNMGNGEDALSSNLGSATYQYDLGTKLQRKVYASRTDSLFLKELLKIECV